MRVRDYLGLALVVIGISTTMLGYHWLGLNWYWPGLLLGAIGGTIVFTGKNKNKTDQLGNRNGPGDYGDRHYHGGAGEFNSSDDSRNGD